MMYRTLVSWLRSFLGSEDVSLSAQEVGRFAECVQAPKAEHSMVATNWYGHIDQVHPVFGTIASRPAKAGETRKWNLEDYEPDGDRGVMVVGDRSGPLGKSFDDILEIVDRRDEIEKLIVNYLYGNPESFPFVSRISDVFGFDIFFFDANDSGHYRACLRYTLPERAPFRPFTRCLGNGDWELEFEMRGLEVVAISPEEAI